MYNKYTSVGVVLLGDFRVGGRLVMIVYHGSDHIIEKPKNFDKMLELAGILSQGIPQVRVDLYEVGGKPYFGEMTFTSAGGFMDFYTDEFLEEMGSHVELPTK